MTEQQYQIALKKFLDNGGKIEKLPYYSPDYSGRMLNKHQIKFGFDN